MRVVKLFKQLYRDFSSIHVEANKFSGFYFINFLKLTTDRIVKTVGYIWHFFLEIENMIIN